MLSIGLSAIIVLIASILLSTLLQSRIKNQTILEVEQTGANTLEVITQSVRNATAVIAPSPGQNGAALSLQEPIIAKDPTAFDLVSGAMRISEGGGVPVALSSSRVVVSGLTFSNVSASGTHGAVRIQFTVSAVNNSGRNEYDYSKVFYGTASIR